MRAHGGKFVVDLALDWKERTRNTERSDRTLTSKVDVRKGVGVSREEYSLARTKIRPKAV